MHFISLCSHFWPEPAFSFQSVRAVTVLITYMPLRRWRGSIPFSSLPIWLFLFISSVRFSCSVVSDCLQPHGLQHARPPCLSPTPRACSNSCPSHQWCHPTISSSVVPFFSRLQSFPVSGSFSMSQLFASGGQRIGASPSASVCPMNIQGLFPLVLTGLISWQSKGFSRVFVSTTVQKYQFFHTQLSLWFKFHIHTWLLEKP